MFTVLSPPSWSQYCASYGIACRGNCPLYARRLQGATDISHALPAARSTTGFLSCVSPELLESWWEIKTLISSVAAMGQYLPLCLYPWVAPESPVPFLQYRSISNYHYLNRELLLPD
jgi:hypothetical protein